MDLQNKTYEELLKIKNEKAKEWLEYLSNNEQDDILWKSKNRVFASGFPNILLAIKKIKNYSIVDKQEELLKSVGTYINEVNREKLYNTIKQLNDLEIA